MFPEFPVQPWPERDVRMLKLAWLGWIRSISSRLALRIAGGTLGVLAVATGIFLWRASTGPVSLGLLTPRLEAMINAGLSDIQLRFNDSIIEWSEGNQLAYLQFIDVQVVDPAGVVLARVPRANVTLSGPALLAGTVAPTRVELVGASASIVRRADGGMQLGLRAAGEVPDARSAGGGGSQGVSQAVLEAMLRPKPNDTLSRYLKRFAITGAKLSVFDQETKAYWRADNASLTFDRKPNGVIVALNAPVSLADKSVWQFTASARYAAGSEDVALEAAFKPVRPSLLARSGAGLKFLEGIDVPVQGNAACGLKISGQLGRCKLWLNVAAGQLKLPSLKHEPINIKEAALTIEMDATLGQYTIEELTWKGRTMRGTVSGDGGFGFGDDGSLRMLSADWTAENIFIDAPNVFEGGLALETARFKGTFDAPTQSLTIEQILARKGGFELSLSGSLVDHPVSMGVVLNGQLKDLPVADLKRLWPAGAAPGARDWIIANIHQGTLRTAQVAVNIQPGAITGEAIPDEMMNVSLALDGLKVTYLHGLPDLQGVAGTALLTGDRFSAQMTSGSIGAVQLRQGSVTINETHKHGAVGVITGDITGPTRDILQILDSPRLRYPTRYGIPAAKAGGTAEANFTFSVPMLKDLEADDVGIEVAAELRDVKMPLNGTVGITGGKFAINLTTQGLKALGAIQLNGAPVGFIWNEDFTGTAKFGTHIDVTATLTEAQRSIFGLTLSPYLEGRTGIVATLTGGGGRITNASVEANLVAARLAVPELNWAKPEDAGALLKATVAVRPGGVIDVSSAELTGQGIKASGRVVVEGGKVSLADFKKVQLGPRNDFSLVYKGDRNGAVSIDLKGRSIDAGGLLNSMSSSGDAGDNAAPPPAAAPVSVRADVGVAYLQAGSLYNGLRLTYADNGDHLTAFTLDTAADSHRVRGEMTTAADGSRRFRLSTSDFGWLLRGATGFRSIIGGNMQLNADLTPVATTTRGDQAHGAFDGSIRIDNFKLVDQPFFARLLSAGSFTGIDDLLRGEGITFTRLEQSFHGRGDVITLADGQAAGPSIGLTAQGTVNRKKDVIDINGTIVPLYGLNSMFGEVPLIGDILGSRNGEGIFGVTYGVRGDLDELKVAVNPISVLAPGFLRKLFQMGPTPKVATPMPAPQVVPATPVAPKSGPKQAPQDAPKVPERASR